MTDPDLPPAPGPTPGERRLAHPPSDRYRAAEATAIATSRAPDPAASIVRGVVLALVVAIAGAAAIVILGGVAAVTGGLVVLAGATGWGVAAALRFGAGVRLAPRRRVVVAVAIALVAVALGQVGIWQYARIEGGVLPLVDYLAEVFGPLVPLELAAAGLVAWLAAR